MTELNASKLSQLPPKVAGPPYDRSRLKRGIAHFGVGNFHRAHQAFYIDRCLALPGQEDWGIVGIGLGGGERGRQEAVPLVAEDFTQWVIEDRFTDGRPNLENVGVQLSHEVKLWVKWFVPGPVDGSVAFGGERRVVRRSRTHLARIQQEARKIVDSALFASN